MPPAVSKSSPSPARRLARLGRVLAVAGLTGALALAQASAQSLTDDPDILSATIGSAPDDGTADGALRGMVDPADTPNAEMPAASALTAIGADAKPAETGAAGMEADAESEAPPPRRTGAIPAISGTQAIDDRGMLGRINLREKPVGDRSAPPPAAPLDQGPGIRAGSFVLRPSITQGIGAESQTYADGMHTSRLYSQTEIRGTLSSDWSRHALTISGSGIYQKNIAGTGETQPSVDIGADLRLDLAPGTTADLTGSYDFQRESITDPNAVANALRQGTINTFTGGAELSRDLGRLRGSIAASAIRTTYGDVRLADGSTLSQADRNALAGEFTARLGYQLSGALTPFVQAKYRRTQYDRSIDSLGYRRSSNTYTAQLGLTADLDEKLSAEIAAGYVLRRYEDARLPDVSGPAIDIKGHWSPHRGTDIALDLGTQIDDSTTVGASGSLTYSVGATLTQQVRDDVVAHLGAQYLYLDYRQNALVPDEQIYTVSGGVSWYLNRYLSLDGTTSFSRARQKGVHDQDLAEVEVGLTLRR